MVLCFFFCFLLLVCTALAVLACLVSEPKRLFRAERWSSPLSSNQWRQDTVWPPHIQSAISRQEGFILVLVCTGTGVAQAPHQLLLFSGSVCLTWLVRSTLPWGRLHHQALVLLLLLLLLAGPSELIHQVDRVWRLRRGKVYLDGRHTVWGRLHAVGLGVYRQDMGTISRN